MTGSRAASLAHRFWRLTQSRRDRASRPAGGQLVSWSREQGFKNRGGKERNRSGSHGLRPGSLYEPVSFRLGTLLPRAPTAPQTSRGRTRNTPSPGPLCKGRQGLRKARPLLGTGNRGVNNRGAVWALQPALRGSRPQTEGGHPDPGAAGHEPPVLGLPWEALARTPLTMQGPWVQSLVRTSSPLPHDPFDQINI